MVDFQQTVAMVVATVCWNVATVVTVCWFSTCRVRRALDARRALRCDLATVLLKMIFQKNYRMVLLLKVLQKGRFHFNLNTNSGKKRKYCYNWILRSILVFFSLIDKLSHFNYSYYWKHMCVFTCVIVNVGKLTTKQSSLLLF